MSTDSVIRALTPLRALVGPVVLVGAVPLLFGGYQLTTLTTTAVAFLVAVGFNVVFGYSGTISFGHAAFALLGAYTAALGQVRWDWSYLTGSIVATLVCVAVGVVTALPTLRMAPFAIAVITLLYLPALNSLIQYFDSVTMGANGVPALPASLDTNEKWYLVAALGAVAWLICRNLVLSPLGRAWEVSRVAPELAESLGLRLVAVKLIAVGLAAGLAGLAGSLWPVLNGYTSPDTFNLSYAILILVTVVIGGQASINGPVAGSIVVAAITLGLTESFSSGGAVTSLVYALIVLAVILLAPGGTIELLQRLGTAVGSRIRRRSTSVETESPPGEIEALVEQTMPRPADAILEIRGMSWAVGGVRILDDVTMTARPGRVHGLIGPNGAGKTSLLNCACGYVRPEAGHAALGGTELRGNPSRRSRAGLSRTFQQPALLEHRTVLENVLPGVDAHRRASLLEHLFRLPRAVRERRDAQAEALKWLHVVGLGALHDLPAGRLGPGQRRQLEIARVLATRPRVLLMDEPAAGLTAAELRVVERIIRAVASRGVAVVLIEHHFDLVQRVCDEVTVLDAGAVIFHGAPSAAALDPRVVEAYLGADEVDDAAATEMEDAR